MRKEERYKKLIEYFSKHMPKAETELDYSNPFHLLTAVILSAQCTDKRVNMITPPLFKRFPSPQKMADSNTGEILEFIRSCSYPNSKANHLLGMAQHLVKYHNGNVPSEIDDLVKIPGVGRKTANVVAAVVYKKPVMAVDTHVFRVANRVGLTNNSKTPLQTELELVKHIPEDKIADAHHWLILHGRYVCKARRPLCGQCGISGICRYFELIINKSATNAKRGKIVR